MFLSCVLSMFLLECTSLSNEDAQGPASREPRTAPIIGIAEARAVEHPDLEDMRRAGRMRVLLLVAENAPSEVSVFLPKLSAHLNITIQQVRVGFPAGADVKEGVRLLLQALREGKGDMVVAPLPKSAASDVLYTRVLAPALLGNRAPTAREMRWAVRESSTELRDALDQFIFAQVLTPHKNERYSADLVEIKKRGVVRVAMLNNGASYFIYRGQEVGFQYELAHLLAMRLGVRLQVVVPEKPDAMLQLLHEGLADIVPYAPKAMLNISPKHLPVRVDVVKDTLTAQSTTELTESSTAPYPLNPRPGDILYTPPFITADYIVVQSREDMPVRTLAALSGKTLYARKSSTYWPVVENIQSTINGLTLVAAPESSATETLIDAVGKRQISMTVANSILLSMELTWRDDIQGSLVLSKGHPLTYAVAPTSVSLHERLQRFTLEEPSGKDYNRIYQKYFANIERMAEVRAEDAAVSGNISPYDRLARKYAKKYDLDWRLIVAQMYQESKFDPRARSWAGARGLMQLMPATAQELHVRSIEDPEENIAAGVRYLAGLVKRFGQNENSPVAMRQRIRFALASYNAGHGHVRDARRLAAKLNLDPDRWFGNVEKAIVLLEQPKYYKKAQSGYCRGREPQAYVSRIQSKYDAFSTLRLDKTQHP